MSIALDEQPCAAAPSPSLLWHPAGSVLARLLVGGLFVYASAGKIGHTSDFARIIYSYRALDPDLVNMPAMWLP
ncbi:MAG: hypothetical protein JSV65_08835 [Armatimonadota bacterium]|nr:MAG: hypothetical protein JSV65_08835 [Armatimonadota bacterium]